MGGKSERPHYPKNEYATLEIVLSNNYINPTDEVKGKLYLRVHQQFALDKLEIKFVGYEYVKLFDKKMKKSIPEYKKVLLEQEMDPDLNVPRGRILERDQGPIEFSLPTQHLIPMPTSALYTRHNLHCEVKYEVIASLVFTQPNIQPLKCVCLVEVSPMLEYIERKEKTVNVCIRTPNAEYGIASMKLRLDKTALIVPYGFDIYIDYNNMDCSKPVRSIVVSLKERVTVIIKDAPADFVEYSVVGQWKLKGVAAGETEFYNPRLTFPQTEASARAESCVGRLFKKDYILVVEAKYNISSLLENPQLEQLVSLSCRDRSRSKQPVPESLCQSTEIQPPNLGVNSSDLQPARFNMSGLSP